ncbi:SRPBCC domain-containing protein [Actinoplanes sp. NPDC024001]|uniref:SRPBCC family protein n=1 Tax=Actinoplanes sp. NPDC024001 TaxID=3154598 RepID=UPI003406387D
MTDLVITRIFDAPREMVYRAFTDPDQLSAWFGPVGWSVPRDSVDMDVRVGGHQRFTMVNDADPAMTSPANATFVEVIENELLVGEENVAHIPEFGADVLRLRIEFHDEEGGRTRLVLTQSPFPEAMAGDAREGWGSSFTKLDKLLA